MLCALCSCKKDQVEPKFFDDHDEPVIIENGSMKVDFNATNNPVSAEGTLSADGRIYDKDPSGAVLKVRIWTRETSGSGPFRPRPCNNGTADVPCDGTQINGNRITVSLGGSRTTIFQWFGGTQNRMRMISTGQRFSKYDSARPHRLMAAVDDGGQAIKPERIEFLLNGRLQPFDRPSNGDIVMQLCLKEDVAHCTYFTPQ